MSAVGPSTVGFMTIIAKNYLAHARVLMASVEEHHPGARRIVVLTDEVEDSFDPRQEPFEILLSSELDLPDSAWFHFRYDTLELTTGVKPFAMRQALKELGIESLIYLDADIRLYAPLDPVVAVLGEASIVLTPHLLNRSDADGLAVERQLLRTGAYNLGFIAVRNCAATESFLAWWCDRLTEHCLVALEQGLFVDQKWVDLVPGMFDGVRILRDPGLNVAWWNLPQRPVSNDGGSYRADGERLYFFHFSGFKAERPEMLSKHAAGAAMGTAKELFAGYAQALLGNGYAECKSWGPAYERFADGTPIPAPVRDVSELEPAFRQSVEDPFSAAGRGKIFEFWNQPVEAPGGGSLTRLAYWIYQSEPQLQATMPDVFGAHREAYEAWFASEGATRYRLPPELTTPLNTTSRDDSRAQLPPVALRIYESRKDLQRAFPDPYGKDAIGWLTWLLSYGVTESVMDAVNRRALRLEFERLLEQVGSPIKRSICRAKLAWMTRSARRNA